MTEPVRPDDIPDDYTQVLIQAADGTSILAWARVVETETPDGRKKLTIEGVIPE